MNNPTENSRIPIGKLVARLEDEYGTPVPERREPLAVLVETILSQNTSDVNSHRAFRSLRACFPDWDQVVAAETGDIARSIDRGGLANIKAQRIKDVLAEIKRRRGRLDLAFLAGLGVPEGLAWLETLPGVGEKTSRCTLLFAFGMPALPVDTHVWRVSKRLGLIGGGASVKEAHRVLGERVPPALMYRFHVLLVSHGRKVCHSRAPACAACPLNGLCPGFNVPGRGEKGKNIPSR